MHTSIFEPNARKSHSSGHVLAQLLAQTVANTMQDWKGQEDEFVESLWQQRWL